MVFLHCRCCKLNTEYKNHNYTTKHKTKLKEVLLKEKENFDGVKFFLTHVIAAQEGMKQTNFWCTFCEYEVDNSKNKFLCQKSLLHLTTNEHKKNVTKYLKETGSNVQKHKPVYLLSPNDLTQYWKRVNKFIENLAVENIAARDQEEAKKVFTLIPPCLFLTKNKKSLNTKHYGMNTESCKIPQVFTWEPGFGVVVSSKQVNGMRGPLTWMTNVTCRVKPLLGPGLQNKRRRRRWRRKKLKKDLPLQLIVACRLYMLMEKI